MGIHCPTHGLQKLELLLGLCIGQRRHLQGKGYPIRRVERSKISKPSDLCPSCMKAVLDAGRTSNQIVTKSLMRKHGSNVTLFLPPLDDKLVIGAPNDCTSLHHNCKRIPLPSFSDPGCTKASHTLDWLSRGGQEASSHSPNINASKLHQANSLCKGRSQSRSQEGRKELAY